MVEGELEKRMIESIDAYNKKAVEEARAIGQKWDEGKRDWHALPLCLLEPLVQCLEAGIKKGYGRHNCIEKFDNPDRRFFSGAMRHMVACQLDPLAIDEETGCYHAAQVAFNTLMRLYHCKKDKPPTLWLGNGEFKKP